MEGSFQGLVFATNHFFGTYMGRQCFIEREDGYCGRDMAELLVNLLKCCGFPAQVDYEIFWGLEGDRQHPIEQFRQSCAPMRSSEKHYSRYRFNNVLVRLIIQSEQTGLTN